MSVFSCDRRPANKKEQGKDTALKNLVKELMDQNRLDEDR
jgi:hypothetical protein